MNIAARRQRAAARARRACGGLGGCAAPGLAGSAAPQQPLSGSGMGVGGGGAAGVSEADLARVEELQQLVDRQALQLRRRNDELLDLQRNHEAFREKFVLFREGMRSKSEEADARFRHLAPQLHPKC